MTLPAQLPPGYGFTGPPYRHEASDDDEGRNTRWKHGVLCPDGSVLTGCDEDPLWATLKVVSLALEHREQAEEPPTVKLKRLLNAARANRRFYDKNLVEVLEILIEDYLKRHSHGQG